MGLADARVVDADQQLTACSRNGLDPRDIKGLNRPVQKKPPLSGGDFVSRSHPHHPAICTNF